jgi:hypothetical protein
MSFDYLSASTISIPIGPDQSHLGHVSIPVVMALRSILARSMMSPHFGHMCALIHRFSRLIEGSQIQQIVHSVQLLRKDNVLIRDFPEMTQKWHRALASR